MSEERNNKSIAAAGTILFHGLLLLLFLLLALRTPLPLPGEEGVEVNLGYSDAGMGRVQQPVTQPSSTPPPRPQPTPQSEEIATQQSDESVALPTQPRPQPRPETPAPRPQPQPEPEPEPEPEPPRVDPRALYPGRQPSDQAGQNEGTTGQPGDQGRPDGTPDSPSYDGSGGAGDGISFNLSGRSATSLPVPEYPSREQGDVVVEIWVDKEGRVVRARAGARGTTTADPQLRRAAEQAALRARFSANPNAPDEQTGTITYKFLRQN
jgi:TonB family protein